MPGAFGQSQPQIRGGFPQAQKPAAAQGFPQMNQVNAISLYFLVAFLDLEVVQIVLFLRLPLASSKVADSKLLQRTEGKLVAVAVKVLLEAKDKIHLYLKRK